MSRYGRGTGSCQLCLGVPILYRMTTTERVPQSPVPSWVTLGDRITKARKIAGLDIKELGEKSGIHRNSLSKYEDDRGPRPRAYMLNSIAMACKVSADWLATGLGHPFDGTDRPPDEGVSGTAWTPLRSISPKRTSPIRRDLAAA